MVTHFSNNLEFICKWVNLLLVSLISVFPVFNGGGHMVFLYNLLLFASTVAPNSRISSFTKSKYFFLGLPGNSIFMVLLPHTLRPSLTRLYHLNMLSCNCRPTVTTLAVPLILSTLSSVGAVQKFWHPGYLLWNMQSVWPSQYTMINIIISSTPSLFNLECYHYLIWHIKLYYIVVVD